MFVFYCIVVEFCVLEYGGMSICDVGVNGIFLFVIICYVLGMSVEKGVIMFIGQESLSGFSVIMMFVWDNVNGIISWMCNCNI